MKSKQLHKVAMIVSCMNFLQSTAPDAYQVHLRFLTNNEPRTEHHVNLTQKEKENLMVWETEDKRQLNHDQIKLIESFLGGDTERRAIDKQVVLTQAEKDEIARDGFSKDLLIRLEKDINASLLSGQSFNSLNEARVLGGMYIEDGKLVVNCALMRPFRVEKIRDAETHIHILEPGIENSVYVKVLGELDAEGEGKYDDLQQLKEAVTPRGLPEITAWVDRKEIYYMGNFLNNMSDLLSMMNFSRIMASQVDRNVDDIRKFFGTLTTNSRDKEMSITKDSEPRHYSLNLRNRGVLMAVLHVRDQGEGDRYSSKFETRKLVSNSLGYPFYLPGDINYMGLILQSIELGSYTYRFKPEIDVNQHGIDWIDLVTEGLQEYVKHLFDFSTVRDDWGFVERYKQINLAEAMRPIEERYATKELPSRRSNSRWAQLSRSTPST